MSELGERLPAGRIRTGWLLMTLVLLVEAGGGAWLAWRMIQAAWAEREAVAASEFAAEATMMTIGIIVVVLLGTLWVLGTLVAATQQKKWARASNLTIQVLVFAAATGILQGIMGTAFVGVVLLALAVLGLAATWLSRPVKRAESEER